MYEISGDAGIIRRADPASQKVGIFDFIDDIADYGCLDLSDGLPGAIKVVCNSSCSSCLPSCNRKRYSAFLLQCVPWRCPGNAQ